MNVQNDKAAIAQLIAKIPTLAREWNVEQMTQNQWNEIYTERSELHKILQYLEEALSYFLKNSDGEHKIITDLIQAKTEVLLILQEILFMDAVTDTELSVCQELDRMYQLSDEHTFRNQQLARKRNMLRISVLHYLMGDEKKSRRAYREACEISVIGNTIRNVYLFGKCYEQHAAFERNLPVEGFQYNPKHLPELLDALHQYRTFLCSLMKDEENYQPRELALLTEAFEEFINMASRSFELLLKFGQRENGILCLEQFADTADQAPESLQKLFKPSIWYMEATYVWALTREAAITKADTFLKGHLTRPEKSREQLSDYTADAGLIAQIDDMLYFSYYVVWSVRYPLAVNECKLYRTHLSNSDLIIARQIIDACAKNNTINGGTEYTS